MDQATSNRQGPDKDVKVEKALLDLNEMKTQFIQEKAKDQPAMRATGMPPMNSVSNNFFRDTAYTNKINTVAKPNTSGLLRPMSSGGSQTATSFFSTGA